MEGKPPIAERLWKLIPANVQAVLWAFIERLLKRIDSLEKENAKLKAKVEKLGKNSKNSSFPASTDKPGEKQRCSKPARKKPKGEKKTKGAQKGHPKHERPLVPPEQVDETVVCKPPECEECGTPLEGDDPDFVRHQVWDIPPIEPIVTEYQVHRLTCSCGHCTKGKLPDEIGTGHFGPQLVGLISLLTGVCRMSKRLIQSLLDEVFGLAISTGQICRLQGKMADATDPVVEEAIEYLRTQPTNIDETRWKERLKRCWLWVAATKFVTLFRIRPTRGADVLHEILGPDYEQVVTSDRAMAYDTLPIELRQLCWAHLARDFQAMVDRENDGSLLGKRLVDYTDQLFEWWQKVRDGTWQRKTFQRKLKAFREEFLQALEFGSTRQCPKTSATCRHILDRQQALWTFAYAEGVEPTNNAGEREVRHPVTYRKICYGTDSAQGSKFVANVMTISSSLKRQDRNVLEFLTESYRAHNCKTQPPSILPD